MKRFACLLILVYLAKTTIHANEQTSACAAATTKVDYMGLQTIPEETSALVESYRQDWRIFCGDGSNRPSLADLYKKAREVNKKLNDAPYAKETELLYELIPKNYPKFLPAFVGGPANGFGDVFFDLSTEQFRANAHRGTTEDQMFFSSLLFSDVKLGEPADGCTNYGEVDWVSLLKDLVRLKKAIKNDFYAKWITDLENGFLEEPGPEWRALRPIPPVIRSCNKNKDAVLKDLKAIRDFVRKEPMFANHLSKAEQLVELVESGKIDVEVVYGETTP